SRPADAHHLRPPRPARAARAGGPLPRLPRPVRRRRRPRRRRLVTAPPRRRSYSQLDVYLKCPEQYFWKYVEKVPETPAIWSPGGTAFHSFAERYLAGELGEQPNDFQVFAAWQQAF